MVEDHADDISASRLTDSRAARRHTRSYSAAVLQSCRKQQPSRAVSFLLLTRPPNNHEIRGPLTNATRAAENTAGIAVYVSARMLFHAPSRSLRHLIALSMFRIALTVLFLALVRCAIEYSQGWEVGAWISPKLTEELDSKSINWDQYKYVQVVTTPEDLCSAVMIWAQIEMYGSRASRLMLYPSNWSPEEVNTTDHAGGFTSNAKLLRQAAKDSYVTLRPLDALNGNNSWTISGHASLLAFNLTDFSRVLVLDSASEVRQNMDELFLLPKSPIAMPYTYFGMSKAWGFSTHLMLVSPSKSNFDSVGKAVRETGDDSTNMQIINQAFQSRIQRISHKQYGFMTNELRQQSHAQYLNSWTMKWDTANVLDAVKIIHYSDAPIPKPWLRAPQDMLNKYMPRCAESEWFGASDCQDRELWFTLYADYARRRRDVCGAGFEAVMMGNEHVEHAELL